MTEEVTTVQKDRPRLFPRVAKPERRRGALRGVGRKRMWATIAERVLRAALVIFFVTLIAEVLLHLAPGSVANVILGENATPERVQQVNTELGLDRPVWQQYFSWLGHAVRGDLGESPINHVKVTTVITDRLPVTLEIAVLALLIAVVFSVLLAVAAAARPGGLLDRVVNGVSSVFLAVPAFVAGPVLIYLLAVQVHVFPVFGWTHIEDSLGGNLRGALLPSVAVALTEIAVFTRILRADLVGTLREDYIAAARAKGMGATYVMFRHVLRPSSFSLVTLAGLSLGRLLGGTVIVEVLFGLPGLGQILSQAITARDVITVQGVVVFVSVIYIVINTFVDISYGLLDPRVRKAARA